MGQGVMDLHFEITDPETMSALKLLIYFLCANVLLVCLRISAKIVNEYLNYAIKREERRYDRFNGTSN